MTTPLYRALPHCNFAKCSTVIIFIGNKHVRLCILSNKQTGNLILSRRSCSRLDWSCSCLLSSSSFFFARRACISSFLWRYRNRHLLVNTSQKRSMLGRTVRRLVKGQLTRSSACRLGEFLVAEVGRKVLMWFSFKSCFLRLGWEQPTKCLLKRPKNFLRSCSSSS